METLKLDSVNTAKEVYARMGEILEAGGDGLRFIESGVLLVPVGQGMPSDETTATLLELNSAFWEKYPSMKEKAAIILDEQGVLYLVFNPGLGMKLKAKMAALSSTEIEIEKAVMTMRMFTAAPFVIMLWEGDEKDEDISTTVGRLSSRFIELAPEFRLIAYPVERSYQLTNFVPKCDACHGNCDRGCGAPKTEGCGCGGE